MGYNLEITRPNDKKTEKKFKLGRWKPVLLEERKMPRGGRRRGRGIGIEREDRSTSGKNVNTRIKILIR